MREFLPLVEFLLSDAKFGEMWLTFVDSDAYRNNLLHICSDLHNIDFTQIVLAKNTQYNANLLSGRNADGFTPSELITKEIQKAENGINQEKKARQFFLLNQLRELIPAQTN